MKTYKKKPNKLEIYINNFKKKYPEVLEEVFSKGYCYAFASILHTTFPSNTIIMYIPIYNHFCVLYYGKLYDIKGVITDQSAISLAERWDVYKLKDNAEYERIVECCITKTWL